MSAFIDTLQARSIGELAYAALTAAAGLAEPIAGFAEAPYRQAGATIVWIGTRPLVGHPRMVSVDALPATGTAIRIDGLGSAARWKPPDSPIDLLALVEAARWLRESISVIGTPRGFAAVLSGAPLAFPLDLAQSRLDALRAAGDDGELEAAAVRLIGVGGGLTPSGDDLVSAFVFARRLLDEHAWRDRAERLAAIAASRTHAISAALFGDTVRGASYGALHELVGALAGSSHRAIESAAGALTAIGHSSGWDLLTGLLLGLTHEQHGLTH